VVPTLLAALLTLAPVGGAAVPAITATAVVDFVVLGGIWLAMRPGTPDVRSVADLDRTRHAGRPVLVELYSNFCLICMANRQVLNSVAAELGAECQIVRVELPTPGGREIADTYRILYTPSYIVFDTHGDLVRAIVPDTVTPFANGYRVLDETGAVVSRLQRIATNDLVLLVRRAA
jgi:thiol-disulfide isomerase/thioredoxin